MSDELDLQDRVAWYDGHLAALEKVGEALHELATQLEAAGPPPTGGSIFEQAGHLTKVGALAGPALQDFEARIVALSSSAKAEQAALVRKLAEASGESFH